VAEQNKQLCQYKHKVARLSSKHAKSKKKLWQLQRHQARQACFLRTTVGCRSVFGLWCLLLATQKALSAANCANKTFKVQLDTASNSLRKSRGRRSFQQQLLKAKSKRVKQLQAEVSSLRAANGVVASTLAQLVGMLAASAHR